MTYESIVEHEKTIRALEEAMCALSKSRGRTREGDELDANLAVHYEATLSTVKHLQTVLANARVDLDREEERSA